MVVAIVAICLLPELAPSRARGGTAFRGSWLQAIFRPLDYHANMAMNGVGSDPGWGPWFTWGNPGAFSSMVSHEAGI